MNYVCTLLDERFASRPDKIAVRCEGRDLTYGQLAERAHAVRSRLRALGLRPGDRLMTALPDCFSALAVCLGCAMQGGEFAPLNNRLGRADYAASLATLRPALVAAPPGHEALRAAAEAGVGVLALDDALLLGLPPAKAEPAVETPDEAPWGLFTTSGTTGHPKVVPMTHAGLFRAIETIDRDYLGIGPRDVVFANPKLFHLYGLMAGALGSLALGATCVLDPDKPSPTRTLSLLVSEKVTVLMSVPAMFAMLLITDAERACWSGLRLCFSAGEILPEAVARTWREKTGLDLWQGYGSTETGSFVLGGRPPDCPPGASGRPIPPAEVVILDENHRPVPDKTPGEIAVRGPSLMRGYLDAPEWTARAFTADGFLLTGDLGVATNGLFTVLGRKDDLFKVGGLWVTPSRVEQALLSHPAVAQCAAVGGAVGAFTLCRAHVATVPGAVPGPLLAAELRRHAAGPLPEHMVPSEIVFHASLPLTASGKVQRFKLRQADQPANQETP